ncbi:MAG: L-serine ammonia-lyase, iron-sulfur-dependent, subunit alpha, partial [Firmicutes bacterium]|nr:L-serine ammonia-lyase, iron-sulfur-dependent, subunit alpha [Bacillota bacterium]
MDFNHAKDLLELCKIHNLPISEVMKRREIELAEISAGEVECKMRRALEIMKESTHKAIGSPSKSMGGLIGGESQKLMAHFGEGKGICGAKLEKGIAYAMAVLETNSSMGLIVAAPTAGSAGVVPGLLLSLQEAYDFSDEDVLQAL